MLMLNDSLLKKSILLSSLLFSSSVFSAPFTQPWYMSANVGAFQGMFVTKYTDQTDVIAQNITDTSFQRGYSAGLRIGYSKLVCNEYLLGAEFAGNYHTANAQYASGAATAAFSDSTYLNWNFDLAFVPGILITNTTAIYGKLGLAYGFVTDSLNSPAGFTPVAQTTNANRNQLGALVGIGIKRYLSDQVALFAEYNYYDYGTVNLPSFTNFTATYAHSSHIYAQDIDFGISYFW